jgi:hypothetical protein
MKFKLLPVALASTLAISSAMNAVTAAPAQAPAAAKASKLYDDGKFGEAAATYKSTINQTISSQKLRIEQLSKDFLGLARSQAAAGNWNDAEQNFSRALGLAKGVDMPRSFIDTVRAGLVEAQVKTGHTDGATSTATTSGVAPAPPTPHKPTRLGTGARSSRYYSPMLSGFTNAQRDPDREVYLRNCDVAYSEQVFGQTSAEAAISNLELAQFLGDHGGYSDASPVVQKVANILPKLSADSQATVGSLALDAACRFTDAQQPLLASILTQPILKLATPAWHNVPDMAVKLSRLADSFQRRRDYQQAETYEKYAVTLLEKTVPANDARLAAERAKLASIFELENKPSAAIEVYEIALPQLDDSQGITTVRTYIALANLYLKTGNKAKAKETAGKLVKLLSNMRADRDRSYYAAAFELAASLAHDGELDTARQIYKTAIARSYSEADQSGTDYQLQEAVRTLVQRFAEMGQLSEAENVYIAVIDSKKTELGETEGSIGAHADLALFYLKHSQWDKAKASAENAVAVMKKFGRNTRNYARLNELARNFQQSDQTAEALALTLTSIEFTGDSNIPQMVDNYARAATLYDKQANKEKSAAMLAKAVEIVSKNLPADLAPMAPQISEVVNHQLKGDNVANSSRFLQEIASEVQMLANPGSTTRGGFNSLFVNRLAAAFEREAMFDEACALYKQGIDRQSKLNGPSSIEVAATLQAYSNALRQAGKALDSQQMADGSRAIYDVYNRQARGEYGVYRPFAPLAETIRNYQMHKLAPDSST